MGETAPDTPRRNGINIDRAAELVKSELAKRGIEFVDEDAGTVGLTDPGSAAEQPTEGSAE